MDDWKINNVNVEYDFIFLIHLYSRKIIIVTM
jgi:hypothetical protein